jgi:hypothetical protein
MQITANQVFLHGEDRYEAGQTYDVAPELATHFVLAGWADSPDVTPPGHDSAASDVVTLDVHDAGHEHEASTHG